MTQIKYKTLTPVHIGSGRLFQGNFEYLYFQNEKTVAIIDEEKVLSIIGEENMDKWLSIIENSEDLLKYLRTRNNTITADDVSLRKLEVIGIPPQFDKTIREQIHSGNGKPILPGSSIKGAIRTAIFTELLEIEQELVKKDSNIKIKRFDYKQKKEISYFTDKPLMEHFFGKDAKEDFFKLLRIGDVQFDKTVCILTETVNNKKLSISIYQTESIIC